MEAQRGSWNSWTQDQWSLWMDITQNKRPLSRAPAIGLADFRSRHCQAAEVDLLFHEYHRIVADVEKWSHEIICHGLGVKQLDMYKLQLRLFPRLAELGVTTESLRCLETTEIEFHYSDFFQDFEEGIGELPEKSFVLGNPYYWRWHKEAITRLGVGCLFGFARMIDDEEVSRATGQLIGAGKTRWELCEVNMVDDMKPPIGAKPSTSVKLNYDCLAIVFEQMGLKLQTMETIARTSGLSDDDVKDLLKHRCSPFRLFRDLVDNPEELLWAMSDCQVILSGSRAASYFLPTARTESSDWDFYTHPTVRHFLRFAIYLRSVGVDWALKPEDYEHDLDEVYRYDLTVLRGTKTFGKLKQRVQLIAHGIDEDSSIKQILRFHSSVVQCFISGFAAVSFYEPLTTSGASYAWMPKSCYHSATLARAQAALDKYKARGVEYVSPKKSSAGVVPTPIVRELVDEQSLCVPLASYLTNESRANNAQMDSYALRHVKWSETSHTLADLTHWSSIGHLLSQDESHFHEAVDWMEDRPHGVVWARQPADPVMPVFDWDYENFECCSLAGNRSCERHRQVPSDLWKFFRDHFEWTGEERRLRHQRFQWI